MGLLADFLPLFGGAAQLGVGLVENGVQGGGGVRVPGRGVDRGLLAALDVEGDGILVAFFVENDADELDGRIVGGELVGLLLRRVLQGDAEFDVADGDLGGHVG